LTNGGILPPASAKSKRIVHVSHGEGSEFSEATAGCGTYTGNRMVGFMALGGSTTDRLFIDRAEHLSFGTSCHAPHAHADQPTSRRRHLPGSRMVHDRRCRAGSGRRRCQARRHGTDKNSMDFRYAAIDDSSSPTNSLSTTAALSSWADDQAFACNGARYKKSVR
jgi:hypothetical protein